MYEYVWRRQNNKILLTCVAHLIYELPSSVLQLASVLSHTIWRGQLIFVRAVFQSPSYPSYLNSPGIWLHSLFTIVYWGELQWLRRDAILFRCESGLLVKSPAMLISGGLTRNVAASGQAVNNAPIKSNAKRGEQKEKKIRRTRLDGGRQLRQVRKTVNEWRATGRWGKSLQSERPIGG